MLSNPLPRVSMTRWLHATRLPFLYYLGPFICLQGPLLKNRFGLNLGTLFFTLIHKSFKGATSSDSKHLITVVKLVPAKRTDEFIYPKDQSTTVEEIMRSATIRDFTR